MSQICMFISTIDYRQLNLPEDVLLTDKAFFTRLGIFNIHKYHFWAHDNMHSTITHADQERFSINVLAGIVHSSLVEPTFYLVI